MTDAWVLVTGDFVRHGGQDRANFELAHYLATGGAAEVHLVAHRVAPELASQPAVRVHLVPRPGGAHLLGAPLLARAGWRVAQVVTRRHPSARVVVNGGNCPWGDVNWVHAVHAAWPSSVPDAPLPYRLKEQVSRRYALRSERLALRRARVVIANSRRTKEDVARLGVDTARVRVVYLGVDEEAYGLRTPEERHAARSELGVPEDEPLAMFAGALGYGRHKGFDTLLDAWARLCAGTDFRGTLVAVGGGVLAYWEREVARRGLLGRVKLLGFTERWSAVLAGADVLVCPSRYDSFGLVAVEALCRGVPALVSSAAGASECFGSALAELVLPRPEDATDLAERLGRLLKDCARWAPALEAAGARLRERTWQRVASELVSAME